VFGSSEVRGNPVDSGADLLHLLNIDSVAIRFWVNPVSVPQPSDRGTHVVQLRRLRDLLALYPNLREDHVRYLEKWGLVRRPLPDGHYSFADMSMLRHVSAEMGQGVAFRSIVRALAAERDGQMTLDFRSETEPARVVAHRPRRTEHRELDAEVIVDRARAEEQFALACTLDDGTEEKQDAAADAYRKALDADPYLIPALINLGNLYYSRDQFVEAQALYERAILLAPDVYEAHFNLGNVHHDRGRLEAARECYAETVSLNPEYAEAHFYLAVTLEKLGRSSDAKPHWRAYQRLAPDGEWIDLAREFAD
jgi:tetratricopeptide (TPR) repeat protein